MKKEKGLSAYLGPGFIVAATGIGAGDLITASVAGAHFGTAVLWTAILGGLLKYFLNEGIARWQLATGTTLLEGWIKHLPSIVSIYFLIYLIIWSTVVAATEISFCGLSAHTVFPLPMSEQSSVVVWGTLHTVLAVILVYFGGYQLIENLMKVFIGLMFGVVIISAVLSQPDWREVITSLITPQIPEADNAITLIFAVVGGVGGSVTLLSYAYWLQEKGWTGDSFLRNARIDLGVAYLMMGLFGIAMIIIASGVQPEKVNGYEMIMSIANRMSEGTGQVGKWIFIFGFWGAVFSSMIGIWHGVPYLFADFMKHFNKKNAIQQTLSISKKSFHYRLFLAFIAFPPILLVAYGRPTWIGILYAVTGAFFMPFLAGMLLYMNNQVAWLKSFRNGWLTNAVLFLTLLFFLALLYIKYG